RRFTTVTLAYRQLFAPTGACIPWFLGILTNALYLAKARYGFIYDKYHRIGDLIGISFGPFFWCWSFWLSPMLGVGADVSL
ncbi:hypothetical protein, partial [Pseudoalteromonas sp. S1731]|uniref:hypothetical protein n=1 Tax=Pseudoalteromonas sp. S1731 TaxID=579515 RepID=UPI001BB23E92